MKPTLDTITGITANNSITTDSSTDLKDTEAPFSYTEWMKHANVYGYSAEEYVEQYNAYIRKWTTSHKISPKERTHLIMSRYKALLKDITLNHTTDEEKRYLSNINYDNPRHVEAALPFFARKIKQISIYYALERDNIKQQKSKIGIGGSSAGIESIIYKYIPQLLRREDFTLRYQDTPITLTGDEFYSDYNVKVVDMYDISQEYFKKEISYDIDIFKDMSAAISTVLQECVPSLQLAGGLNLLLNGTSTGAVETITDSDIEYIPYNSFDNYIKKTDNLNIYNQAKLIPTLLGSTLNYLSGGELIELVKPTTPWRNIFNRYHASINNRSLNNNLKTIDEIGGFYIPKNLGTLTFYSHKPEPVILAHTDSVLSDITRYGNSISMGTTGLPIDHLEDVTWIKSDISNDSLYGDIINDRMSPKFNSYGSIEETNKYPQYGVSRSSDAYGFFDGHRNSIWANSDVYTPEASNVYDIDNRQDDLLVGHQTLYRWRTDVYGNEYSLFKKVQKPRTPESYPRSHIKDLNNIQTGCRVLDGGDTLLAYPPLYTDDIEYAFIDGGRVDGIDPKHEQSNLRRPFVDLRRTGGYDKNGQPITEDHNSVYFGIDPTNSRTRTPGWFPITFHGFRNRSNQPTYDDQAYGGFFTDLACGVVDPIKSSCSRADNYSFNTYSDISSGSFNISTSAAGLVESDAFEIYVNPGFDDFDPEFGFSLHGRASGDEIISTPPIDGRTFSDISCEIHDTDFEYNIYNTTPHHLGEMKIAATTYSDPPKTQDGDDITMYDQKHATGNLYFRTYNNNYIDTVANAFYSVFEHYNRFDYSKKEDYRNIKHEIVNGGIVDMDVIYDTLIIQTKEYLLMEKINFSQEKTTILPNNTTNVLIKTTHDNNTLEKCMGWFFDEDNNVILTGHTAVSSTSEGDVVYPKLYTIDINTLQYTQSFPNTDYPESVQEYVIDNNLSEYIVQSIDTPIISYNDKTNKYNVTYSARLSGSNETEIYSIISSDYGYRKLNLKLLDVVAYHGQPVPYYTHPDKHWEKPAKSRTFRLPSLSADGVGSIIPDGDIRTYNMSMSSTIGNILSSASFGLSIHTKTIPTSSYHINKIAFDPGDGSDIKVNERAIDDGLSVMKFDISEYPDQSDFADPRVTGFRHAYQFNKSVPYTYNAQISAIYSDFSVLIYNIAIETQPYTIQSGFGGMKLVGSKIYTDITGTNKQLITLETQEPRYISNVVLTK
jgi:hypothetical protein